MFKSEAISLIAFGMMVLSGITATSGADSQVPSDNFAKSLVSISNNRGYRWRAPSQE